MITALQESKKDQLSDEEIIRRTLAGEPRLYELIMRRYNAMLYRVGMSIVNNDVEVEDIMQVTYIKAYEKLSTFEHRSSFSTWLTKILINESLYQLKKSKRHISMEANNEMHPANKVNCGESTPV